MWSDDSTILGAVKLCIWIHSKISRDCLRELHSACYVDLSLTRALPSILSFSIDQGNYISIFSHFYVRIRCVPNRQQPFSEREREREKEGERERKRDVKRERERDGKREIQRERERKRDVKREREICIVGKRERDSKRG